MPFWLQGLIISLAVPLIFIVGGVAVYCFVRVMEEWENK